LTKIAVSSTTLHVEIEGLDRLWSFQRRLTIPMAHVRSATADPYIGRERSSGLRFPGVSLPGVIKAGTYIAQGERSFWLVRNPDNVVVIELRDEPYARLVLDVDDPRAVVHAIASAGRPAT
jgi:hypothetical protein